MNNFPAMTEAQRQELIGRLRIYMRTVETGIKAGLATKEDVFNLTVWKIALAALNATPAPVLRLPDEADTSNLPFAAMAWNACLAEVKRLNTQPSPPEASNEQ